ncbi:sensor histidine kinase [Dictyobacter kobayashii]|uniref:histidine kinase n=1 Tax=Dictyobacter kobayashii TaxID=2014872 RepID=A0A402AU08_9CHLR|nr:HAMP domain-containing sensor histidine kinase [Dictyobacter kobayashii]GCE22598.1 hypothetical protein KDK_63980 [Dictyobacter kobayashii]
MYTSLFGYLASCILIVSMVILKYVDTFMERAPYFAIAPLGLISIVVALTWGVGPGLFSLILGLLATQFYIMPGIFTTDIVRDTAIGGPFVLSDLIVIALIGRSIVMQRKLMHVNHQLEQAVSLKDHFITRATHELRTPLTTVRGQAQLALRRLRESDYEVPLPIMQAHFEKIAARAEDMQMLLDDLLDLNSLYAGNLPLHFETCDIVEICLEVVGEQHAVSNRIIVFHECEEHIELYADKKRLSQVATNLISNAIKYSVTDTAINVTIEQKNREVLLKVQNDGLPLLEDVRQHIFEPFYRTPEAEATQPGWGLGLAICKEIIEQHHGRIWVETSLDTGTTFFVQLSR